MELSESEVLEIFEGCGALIQDTHVVLTPKKHPTEPDKMVWYHSSEYVNKDALFTRPHDLMRLCKAIADYWWVQNIEVIASPAVGAVALALLTAYWYQPDAERAKKKPVIPVYAEKDESGIFIFKRGYGKFIPGKRILVVEDVASSGGSAKGVVEAAQRNKGGVIGVTFLWNRGKVTAEDLGGVPEVFSLMESEIPMFLAEEPDQCQLCKERIPFNKEVGRWKDYLQEKSQGDTDFAKWCASQL